MAKVTTQRNSTSARGRQAPSGLWANRRFRSFFGWMMTILIAVAAAGIFSLAFCSSFVINDSSMTPTAQIGDRVLVNRVTYKLGRVKRGDLVAYRSLADENDIHLKRVVGLPGEEVQIRDGVILINGETYLEQNEFPSMINAGVAQSPVKLGTDEYFVLGDDRNNSEDSRFPDVGNIARGRIIGKVWLIVTPFDHFGLVN